MDAPRRAVIAIFVSACGFSPTEATDPGNGPGGPDAGSTTQPTAAKCSAINDPDLQLCVDFDSTPIADTYGHPLTATSIGPTDRYGDPAGQFSSNSTLQVAENTDLDLPSAVTIEMWVKPQLALGDRYLIDNNAQYSMVRRVDGKIKCSLAAAGDHEAGRVASVDWYHVGCTYDGHELRIYQNGSVVGCKTLGDPLGKAGDLGTAIGANIDPGPMSKDKYVGSMDNVHVYSRALTAKQMCTAAGYSTCYDQCP